MQFLRGNLDDVQVEKKHFQKSDILQWRSEKCSELFGTVLRVIREVLRVIQESVQIPWEFMHFSKKCLALDTFALFLLAKPWEFMHF